VVRRPSVISSGRNDKRALCRHRHDHCEARVVFYRDRGEHNCFPNTCVQIRVLRHLVRGVHEHAGQSFCAVVDPGRHVGLHTASGYTSHWNDKRPLRRHDSQGVITSVISQCRVRSQLLNIHYRSRGAMPISPLTGYSGHDGLGSSGHGVGRHYEWFFSPSYHIISAPTATRH